MNMRNFFVLYFVALLSVFSPSKSHSASPGIKTDSLKQVIAAQENDQKKAENLILLTTTYYLSGELDSALKYNLKQGELSNLINYPNGIAEAIFKHSLIYGRKNDLNASKAAIIHYLRLVKPLNDIPGLIKGYYHYGNLLKDQGNADSALYCYHECLTLNSVLNDTLKYIAMYNALGILFQDIYSQYDSATYYYLKTIRLCNETGQENLLGRVYNNLGRTFTLLGEYDEAHKYLELALEYNRRINDTRSMALNLSNIGNNYGRNHEFDLAQAYYDQAAELLKPFGEVVETMDLYNNYATIYKEQGKFDLAIKYYYLALNYFRRQNQLDRVIAIMKNIGVAYSVQKKYALAQEQYDTCLDIATAAGFRKLRMDVLQAIYYNYQRAGDFRKAYEYQKEFYSLKDSLFDLEKSERINELTMKFQKEQDQARILALEKDNLQKDLDLKQKTIQRNAFIFAIFAVIALAVFLFLFIHQRRRKDGIIAQQKIHQLEEEKKLMAAMSLMEGQEEERKRIAIELHDGLGVLLSATKMQFTSIKDTSPENQPMIERATQLLEQASGDVRKISHNMMPGLLTKLGLYEAVEDLFDDISDTENLKTQCIIPEGIKRLPENREIMLYRIIQEIVNNTLKHASAGSIKLEFSELDGKIELWYSDDGKGFDVDEKLESKSIGLKSIQSRVNFLNGTMNIESGPGKGTTYSFQIPT
jgi:signal transduction histidine kinase